MTLRDNAKRLRAHMTDAELRLWYHFRAHRFLGLKFKRQVPLGAYIVDFVCEQHRLVIEVDGSQHMHSVADQRRDADLQQMGYRVLRFWNHDVLMQTESVLEAIRLVIEKNTPSPAPSGHPLPEGEGIRHRSSPLPLGEGTARSSSPLPLGEGPGERVKREASP